MSKLQTTAEKEKKMNKKELKLSKLNTKSTKICCINLDDRKNFIREQNRKPSKFSNYIKTTPITSVTGLNFCGVKIDHNKRIFDLLS